MHYYKFNISLWAVSTGHLTLEEEAIYFRLINHYYDTESPIPTETHQVFRRLRMVTQSDIASQILEEFFEKTSHGWIHKKCDDTLKEYRKTARNSRKNGAMGGRPKKGAGLKVTQNKPSGLPEETQSEPTHKPNQELLTINQEPITNNNYDELFYGFWDSGIRKLNKKKAKALFSRIMAKQKDPELFTTKLIFDVRKRLENNQLGFAEMHPTTYLNNERWTDDHATTGANQNGANQSNSSNGQTYAQRRDDLTRAVTDYDRATNF